MTGASPPALGGVNRRVELDAVAHGDTVFGLVVQFADGLSGIGRSYGEQSGEQEYESSTEFHGRKDKKGSFPKVTLFSANGQRQPGKQNIYSGHPASRKGRAISPPYAPLPMAAPDAT